MKRALEKCKEIYNKDIPLKIEWIIAVLIGIVMLLLFSYVDFKSLTVWSTNILDCIAKGDITDYYSYTSLNKYGVAHRYISGTLYSLILWGIWNIPIWAIQYFAGKTIVKSAILLIWSKLFLVVSLAITLIITYKICSILFKDKKIAKWITFLSATFVFTYIGVFYAGQNDILICMFAILGLYFLIKEKNIWFYIFSALAISIKYFYLIPYIPLILLVEKNIWKIIFKLGIGVSPIIIFNLLVKKFPMYDISKTMNHSDRILKGFFGSGIKATNGVTISFFILAFIIICFMAYMSKPKNKELKNNYIIYYAVAPIIAMLMFSTNYEFYRPILLMPVLMILYGFKPELFRINVILDTVMSGTAFLSVVMRSSYIFSTKYSMNGSLLTDLLGIKQLETFNIRSPIVNLLGNNLNMASSFITTVLFAALGIILVINHPRFKNDKEEKTEIQKPERWIIWGRSVIVVPAIGYLLFKVIGG